MIDSNKYNAPIEGRVSAYAFILAL